MAKKRKNPISSKNFDSLLKSIDWSNRVLEFQRKKRVEAVREFVGFHYTESGTTKRVPVNFLKLAVGIYVRSLAARAPRCLITTKVKELKPTAADLQLAVNQIPAEIDLTQTLRQLVLEALFSIGVAKCGLHTTKEIFGIEYGEPFVDVVTLDDLVIDMAATRFSQIQYVGDTYWMDYEEAVEAFPKIAANDIRPDEYTVTTDTGDERAESITHGSTAELYRDKLQLRDIWLPDTNLMVTYSVTQRKLLHDLKWKDAPHAGPYHFLGFDDVPGQMLPLPPVAVWRDLHELGNGLYRKLGNAADAQKTVLGFQGDDAGGVQAFQEASDGDGITYTGADPKPLKAGGIDNPTLAFFMQCKELSSYYAGNVDSLGGLAVQSETIGQDRLISEASSAQLRDMADKVIDFSKGIFRMLAYYEWTDPVKKRYLDKKIPGTDMTIPVIWNKESKLGKFDMYDLDIDVYSLQDNSPNTQLRKLGVIMREYILPMMPAIQQAGGMLDVQALLSLIARLSDFPELGEIVFFTHEEVPMEGEARQVKPATTTRQYDRVTSSGRTPATQANEMIGKLMSSSQGE